MPLELFTHQGLSHIASVIGVLMYMDWITASCKRLEYAKVCIEVDAKRDIPNLVKVVLRDGSIAHIKVEVPWNPSKCQNCKIFRHNRRIVLGLMLKRHGFLR